MEIGHSLFYDLSLHEYYAYLLRYLKKSEELKIKNKIDLTLHKESWRQTRYIMWSVFQHQSKNDIDIKNIMQFDWEEPQNNVKSWIEKMKQQNGIIST